MKSLQDTFCKMMLFPHRRNVLNWEYSHTEHKETGEIEKEREERDFDGCATTIQSFILRSVAFGVFQIFTHIHVIVYRFYVLFFYFVAESKRSDRVCIVQCSLCVSILFIGFRFNDFVSWNKMNKFMCCFIPSFIFIDFPDNRTIATVNLTWSSSISDLLSHRVLQQLPPANMFVRCFMSTFFSIMQHFVLCCLNFRFLVSFVTTVTFNGNVIWCEKQSKWSIEKNTKYSKHLKWNTKMNIRSAKHTRGTFIYHGICDACWFCVSMTFVFTFVFYVVFSSNFILSFVQQQRRRW